MSKNTENTENAGTLPPVFPGKPINPRDGRSARRLLGRVIVAFQKGEIDNQNAKDLAYLLSVYVQMCQQVEIEERLKKLEALSGKQ